MRPFIFPFPHSWEKTPQQLQLSQGQVTLAQPGMTFFLDAAFMAASYLPWRLPHTAFCREHPGYNGVLMGPFPAQKDTKPIKVIKPSTVHI